MKKKRLLSLLLSFCLVVGLFAAMTTTAYADGDTWVYEVKSGDSLSLICSKNGIDFAKNREWIINTNNLKNPDVLTVGQKLTLPAKGVVKTWAGTTTTTTTGTIATAYTVGGGVTGTTTTAGSYSVPTVTYTLKSGDYVSAVCKKLNIDFAKNDAWIRAANNITNYNNLKVGMVLVLPAPGTTPAVNTAGTGTAATATPVVATTTTASSAGLLAGDTVSYYMFDYVVKSGDTLFNICNSVGANMDTVQKLNNITNPAALRVGQKLSIPSSVVPSSGSYTKIVSHKVVSGDTVQAICKTYGVDYGKNVAKIKALNNRDNLDAIKVGQTILIPVAGTGAASGSSQSGTSSGTSVITNGATGAAYYTLNKSGAVGGTYALTVNGQSINAASAGQVVHVVATPDHGKKLSNISVVKVNGTGVAVDANNNFVMPACNVSVSVLFVDDPNAVAHSISMSNVCDAVNLTYVVNGYANTKAEAGQTVSLIIGTLPGGKTLAEAGKVIDKVYVTTADANPTSVAQFTNGSINPKSFVSVSSNLSFVMPASPVVVTILLKDA